MTPRAHIPWYWSPYVIALGAWDELAERSRVTPREAVREITKSLRQMPPGKLFERIAWPPVFIGLLLLFVVVVAAPLSYCAGRSRPDADVKVLVALLALKAVVLVGYFFGRRVIRRLRRWHARGVLVLQRRHEAEGSHP